LGLDYVRIPIPFLRFFSVPGPQRVVTETEYAPAAQPVPLPSAVSYAAQPAVSTVVMPAMAAAPPVQVAQVAYAPAPQPMVAPAYVPAAAPQVAYAPAPAAMPQVAYAPVPAAVQPVIPAAMPAPSCGPRPPTKATVEELNQQLQAIQKLLDQQQQASQAGGVSLPPIGSGK